VCVTTVAATQRGLIGYVIRITRTKILLDETSLAEPQKPIQQNLFKKHFLIKNSGFKKGLSSDG
jgi:hypothetical protein